MSAKAAVQAAIAANKTVVFSKSYCPYCTKTKSTLANMKADAKVYELDTMGSDGSEWQNYLRELTGQGTVPSIFVNGEFIGGNSDLEAKKAHVAALIKA